MIRPKEDLTGKIFGHLKVLKQGEDYIAAAGNKYTTWTCECLLCGTVKDVLQCSLKRGDVKSCGCIHYQACKRHNEWRVSPEGHVIVILHNTGSEMICDHEDWERLKEYCWSENNRGYAEARVNQKTTLFHTLIIECEHPFVRDHINRNKLDNRRSNLRVVTRAENNRNKEHSVSTLPAGITQWHNNGRYSARIHVNKKRIHLGTFDTIDEALAAIAKKKEVISPL